MTPVRGRVYWAYLNPDEQGERKPYLVVSNNSRNRNFGSCLAVRLTTTLKEERATHVPLLPADAPLEGTVLCDEVTLLYGDELLKDIGALTPTTMGRVGEGLKAALGLY